MSRRVATLLAGLLVLATALVTRADPALAADVTPRLVSQTQIVAPNGDFVLVLDVAGQVPDEADITVTVNGALVPALAGLRQAQQGQFDTPTVGFLTLPLVELPRDAAGRLVVSIPTVVRSRDRKPTNVRLATAGLYPVRVEVRGEPTDPLAKLLTFLTRVDEGALPGPLSVAPLLTVDAGPSLQPDSTIVVTDAARRRLQTTVDVLNRTTVPVTTMVRPDLLDGLQRTDDAPDEALRQATSSALTGRPVISSTSVRVDPAALTSSGLTSSMTTALRAGEDVLAATLPAAELDRSTWIGRRDIDPVALDALRDLGVRQLVLPQDGLGNEDVALDRLSTVRSASGSDVLVAAVDPELSAAMRTTEDPVLAAQQLLAQLVAILLDIPKGTAAGGIVLQPPADWEPSETMLHALFDGLRTNALLRPVTIEQLFRTTPVARDRQGPIVRELRPVAVAGFGDDARRIALTSVAGDAYGSMLQPGNPIPRDVDDLLATALSADLDSAARGAYIDAANTTISPLRAAIAPISARRITIAGQRTEIPITITSNVPYPVRVQLRLASPKLEFPDGNPTVVVDGTAQLRIPVAVKTGGTFPLTVTALTPALSLPAGPTSTLTVRASALSGIGIVIAVGGVLILGGWWVHHVRGVHRTRRTAASAARHPAGTTTADLADVQPEVKPDVQPEDDTRENQVVPASVPDP